MGRGEGGEDDFDVDVDIDCDWDSSVFGIPSSGLSREERKSVREREGEQGERKRLSLIVTAGFGLGTGHPLPSRGCRFRRSTKEKTVAL